ncbi:uncharacterized protein ACR2FA_009361 [Aphomia sociella]
MNSFTVLLLSFNFFMFYANSYKQVGLDPWDSIDELPVQERDADIPPDLRYVPKKVIPKANSVGIGDIFFRRMLAIVLKGGQSKENDDGSIDVVLQMKFDAERWSSLEALLKPDTAITESNLRLSMGYIEDAIYKSNILDKIKTAWSDYIHFYLIEYKNYITWSLGLLGAAMTFIWLWNHMSHRHAVILIFVTLYVYEVFVTYKEAEQEEVKQFLSALNRCQWMFWKTECDIPQPDIVLFLKHMNPLKIGLRMFSTIISEPMIALSGAVKTMIAGITDGLWYPFDGIVYGILILSFNALLVVLLIMILFNYILNIPFNLSFFGLMSIGVKQRQRTLFSQRSDESREERRQSADRISGARLDRLLDVFSHALGTTSVAVKQLTNNKNDGNMLRLTSSSTDERRLQRSASTGRLPSTSFETNNSLYTENHLRKRQINNSNRPNDGSGDAR